MTIYRRSACLAVGVALLAACTGPAEARKAPQLQSSVAPRSAAVPCSDRAVSFGPLLRRMVLTEVSDVTRVPAGAKLRPVRSVVPAIEGAGVVDPAFVYASFARKVGPGVAELGEASPREGTAGEWSLADPISVVVFTSVRVVEASFTERCGGVAASGVVRSWDRSRSGVMQCDLKPQRTEDVVKEAAALSC